MMYVISNIDTKKSQTLTSSLKIGFNGGNGEKNSTEEGRAANIRVDIYMLQK